LPSSYLFMLDIIFFR